MGCGVPAGKGSGFCPVCGQAIAKEAVVCVHCGTALSEPKKEIPKEARSRVVAGILGIFLGALGVHNFYLKRKGRGIAQLLLSLMFIVGYFSMVVMSIVCFFLDLYIPIMAMGMLAVWLGFLMLIASAIWAFVEAILILCGNVKTDGRGMPLRD